MIKNFRTYDLALELHRECEKLKLKGPISNQLKRASLSIPLNLAEGSGRRGTQDQTHFYSIAFDSLTEVQTILQIIGNEDLMAKADKLAAFTYRLLAHRNGLPAPFTGDR